MARCEGSSRTLMLGGLVMVAVLTIISGCGRERVETVVVPAGTDIVATLDTRLSTETAKAGDTFVATTSEPIEADGRAVVQAGAQIRGTVRSAEPSGRIEGRARMTIGFDEIVDPEGKAHPISAETISVQAASTARQDIVKVAAGGVLGAIIGGIAGGGKGAAIGAGTGAAAGTIYVLATKGNEVELASGQRLNVRITAPVSLEIPAGTGKSK